MRITAKPRIIHIGTAAPPGGPQSLRLAQDYPDDYDGILAGAPAIHWDRFQAGQIWHQVVQLQDNGGLIGCGDSEVLATKQLLATNRAMPVSTFVRQQRLEGMGRLAHVASVCSQFFIFF